LRHSACLELLFVTIGLNYEESNDDIRETAAILDAILNFSKCSRVTKVHPADSENRPPGLPKTVKRKTYTDISRFSENMPLGSRTTSSCYRAQWPCSTSFVAGCILLTVSWVNWTDVNPINWTWAQFIGHQCISFSSVLILYFFGKGTIYYYIGLHELYTVVVVGW